VELQAVRVAAGAERLDSVHARAEELDRAVRQVEHVLVPMQRRDARRQRAEQGIAVRARQMLELQPRHRAAARPADGCAERACEQLRAKAEPEHGNLACDRLREQVGLGAERRLGVGVDG
jgi:hypothetical protein